MVEQHDEAGTPRKPRVVVVGGGFGGLAAVRALGGGGLDVTLIDRNNYHLFQPLLYQVATGGLSPANIATPIREILAHIPGVRVVMAEVSDIDLASRRVHFLDGAEQPYDFLIVAAGSQYDYFGNPQWESAAPSLKTLADATRIRRRVLSRFEAAARTSDANERAQLLSFLVVGGGPTGVELAGALAELARDGIRREFPELQPREVRITLLEAGPAILAGHAGFLQQRAARALEALGVTLRLGTLVTAIDAHGAETRSAGDVSPEPTVQRLAGLVLWAAGVRAVPLGAVLARQIEVPTDRSGRLPVDASLRLPGHPQVYVIGDLARFAEGDGPPLPAIAPVAMQQGEHAARAIRAALEGQRLPPFRYRDRGKMATIGRGHAVAELGPLRLWSLPGWLVWLWVHLWQLAGFQNRALVMTQWAWSYFTRNRSARLILGVPNEVEKPS